MLAQLLLQSPRLLLLKRQHRCPQLLKSRSAASSCRRPDRVRHTRHHLRLPTCRHAVPSSSVLVVLVLDRVAPVLLMVVPVAPAVDPLAVVRCTRRVRSPADLRPAPADALALASVRALVALVLVLAVRVLAAVA